MTPPTNSSPPKNLPANNRKSCPFCQRSFLRLGNHLPGFKARGEASYEHLLSKKTLLKSKQRTTKQKCTRCGKLFSRLDTHLPKSARCKSLALAHEDSNPPIVQPVTGQPPLLTPSTSHQHLTPPPEPREILLLPRSDEDWKKANEHFTSALMELTGAADDVTKTNQLICNKILAILPSTTVLARLGLPKV